MTVTADCCWGASREINFPFATRPMLTLIVPSALSVVKWQGLSCESGTTRDVESSDDSPIVLDERFPAEFAVKLLAPSFNATPSISFNEIVFFLILRHQL